MVTTVTDNSPQAINTSLFSLEKDTDEKAKLLNEKLNEVNSAIAEINKILDGINKDAGVVSVNGKQGIVTLDASDIGGLATVATSGSYNDLSNKPSIPTNYVPNTRKVNNKALSSDITLTASDVGALPSSTVIPAAQVPSDWNATSGVARILNKPSLASVATSGSYSDLSNKPTIPSKTSQLTNDSGFVSPQNVLFNDTDVPEGSGNLNTTATAHKITTYRNGLTIPYQMDNTNDGGLLRVRGTSEDNCVLELGTWDDSGSGETIQFNYYPTTSKDTPTHSVSVPKKSGTIALTSDVPTKTSQLTNDSNFVTSSSLSGKVNKSGDTMTGNLYFHGSSAMVIGYGQPPRDFVGMNDSAYNTMVDGAYMAFGDDETGGVIVSGDGIDMWAPPDNDLVRFWNEDSSTPVASIDGYGWLKGKAYCSKRGIVSSFSNWTVFNNFINSEKSNLTLDEDELVPDIEGGTSGGYWGSSTKAFVRGNGSPAPNTTYSMWFVETTLALNDDNDGQYGVQVAYGLTSSSSNRSTFRRFLIDGTWTAWGSNDI